MSNKRYTITFKLNEYEYQMLKKYQEDNLSITPKSLMLEALEDRVFSSYDSAKMDFED